MMFLPLRITIVVLALLLGLSSSGAQAMPELAMAERAVAKQADAAQKGISGKKTSDLPAGVSQLREGGDGFSDSTEVFSCLFDDDWDTNYDSWPDRWTRVEDEIRPSYVKMAIQATDPEIEGRKLTIFPNGASARVSSPPIHIVPKFSYITQIRLRAKNVRHGKTVVRIAFFDEKGNLRQVEESEPVDSDGEWIDVEIGPIKPNTDAIDRMVLQVDFERGERGDLESEISFADIHLLRQPSIEVHTGSQYNVYTDPKDVVVTCSLSGILDRNPEIRFQLLDATNQKLGDQGIEKFHGHVISESVKSSSEIIDGFGNADDGYEGTIDWHPPIREHGFYRVRVQMLSSTTGEIMRNIAITIAVVQESTVSHLKGEFGWSLRKANEPLSFDELQELLPLTGISLVKLPVWFAHDDIKRGDEFLSFAGQLAAREIEMVAIMSDPTDLINNVYTGEAAPPIESLLSSDSSYWLPLFDHVITKLSLQVRWWQLGFDDDTSFIGSQKVIAKLQKIRHQMFRFGQDIRLGLGWRWDYLKDWGKRTPWDFEQLSYKEQLNAPELKQWMQELTPATARRWVLVEPSDEVSAEHSEQEQHQNRVRDFVEQIIVAKVHGADGIFVSNPFSGIADPDKGKSGVMNQDGTPGELLLPWRTCALHLSGATYIGSQIMPQGSSNWIFKRSDGQIVMVLWNKYPVTEKLYLGEEIEVVDIWGKSRKPKSEEHQQLVEVDRTPHFIVGLSEEVARWRMNTRFENERIPSVFGVSHPNGILFRNTFSQGVGGSVRLFIPKQGGETVQLHEKANKSWSIIPEKIPVNLAVGRSNRLPFEVSLIEAGYGKQIVRIDFKIEGDREYRFSVWRELHVGLGDVRLSVQTEINNKGRLIVTQRMQNSSDSLANFKCQLYAPPNRRKRVQVYQLGDNIDKKIYSYFNGKSMVGREMKLRVEEVDGDRVLIYRFVIDPDKRNSFVSDEGMEEEPEDDEASHHRDRV